LVLIIFVVWVLWPFGRGKKKRKDRIK
jgi:cbb3-type cytochrome oxidase subunit 3